MRLPAIIICLLIPACAICQDYKNKFGKGKITDAAALRAELGWNRSSFASLGISYVRTDVNKHLPFSLVAYAAFEADQAPRPNPDRYYACKGGLEMALLFMSFGAELRNNTDFAGRSQIVLTPKVGLSFYGYISFFFGYNLFDRDDNIFGTIHNQLSLNVNLNRKLFNGSLFPDK